MDEPTRDAALDKQAYMEKLYREQERLMFYIAKQFSLDLYVQEEIVQNALICLLQKVDKLQALEPYARISYIATTVRNCAINHHKKHAREQKNQISLETLPVENMPHLPPTDRILIRAENQKALLLAYHALPEADQILLAGKYILHLSDAEIAQQLQCKPDSVRMKLTRARRKLLAQLVEEGIVNE